MTKETYLKRLCRAILQERFNDKKYRTGGKWFGVQISTMRLLCSYGVIGFAVTVDYFDEQVQVKYDWESGDLTIDEMPWKYYINLNYLLRFDIHRTDSQPWPEHKHSVELECYTDAGEDMIIDLDRPTKAELQTYIDNFDIDEEVILWWQDGREAAKSKGVPFDNIGEHYRDYQNYLKWLQGVANRMPF